MNKKVKLMAHLVSGYPTDKTAFDVACALIEGGADILEIQLPFSDPSADGPAIQRACTAVLERGYSTKDGLSFVSRLRSCFKNTAIYIMSYASLVYTPGVKAFCKSAVMSGANGVIVPDMPFDCDEGLTEAALSFGMENIPVAAPSMRESRLEDMLSAGFKHVYAALRAGITGQDTIIGPATLGFLKRVSSSGVSVYGGFGISEGKQAKAIAPFVDAVVAGSVFVRIIAENLNDTASLAAKIKQKANELSGCGLYSDMRS